MVPSSLKKMNLWVENVPLKGLFLSHPSIHGGQWEGKEDVCVRVHVCAMLSAFMKLRIRMPESDECSVPACSVHVQMRCWIEDAPVIPCFLRQHKAAFFLQRPERERAGEREKERGGREAWRFLRRKSRPFHRDCLLPSATLYMRLTAHWLSENTKEGKLLLPSKAVSTRSQINPKTLFCPSTHTAPQQHFHTLPLYFWHIFMW